MFDQPPGIFLIISNAIAGVTGWFNWEAWSAIGTVGALWYAVVESSRNGRAERKRAAGILTALIGYLEPISEAIPEFRTIEEYHEWNELFNRSLTLDILKRGQKGLEAIGIGDLAAVGMSEWTTALPIALDSTVQHFSSETISNHDLFSLNSASSYISEAVATFRKEREIIIYGVLGSYLRNTVSRFLSRLTHIAKPDQF